MHCAQTRQSGQDDKRGNKFQKISLRGWTKDSQFELLLLANSKTFRRAAELKTVNLSCFCWQIRQFELLLLANSKTFRSEAKLKTVNLSCFCWQIQNFALHGWTKYTRFELLLVGKFQKFSLRSKSKYSQL
jgi:hypothetical protein